jgi:hypothetical protein
MCGAGGDPVRRRGLGGDPVRGGQVGGDTVRGGQVGGDPVWGGGVGGDTGPAPRGGGVYRRSSRMSAALRAADANSPPSSTPAKSSALRAFNAITFSSMVSRATRR